jgi:hypothetical protein
MGFVADPNTLSPDLRRAVLDVVGRHADQKTWDTLHELELKTQSIEQKGNFYDAMAGALSPELAKRTLPLSWRETSWRRGDYTVLRAICVPCHSSHRLSS